MSFTICLKVNILPNGYTPILDYYNSNRGEGTEELQELNRLEGGFMIKIPENKDEPDANDRIRQLRWSNLRLVSDIYIGFNDEQLNLLYKAFVNYLGENNVYKIEKNITHNRIPRNIEVCVSNGTHHVKSIY